MPRISSFYGIVIYMYYMDHNPPHFHAIYGDHEAIIDIASLKIIRGDLPSRASTLVSEWAMEHKTELEENWNRIIKNESLKSIEPLR